MNCVFHIERNSHILMIPTYWPLANFALPQFNVLFTFNMQNLRSIVRRNCYNISLQIAIVLVFALNGETNDLSIENFPLYIVPSQDSFTIYFGWEEIQNVTHDLSTNCDTFFSSYCV